MKKLLFSLLFILVALSSCKTYQKIIYFQDVCPDSVVKVLPTQTLRFVPGDRLAINITSTEGCISTNLRAFSHIVISTDYQ